MRPAPAAASRCTRALEDETGQAVDFHQCGSVRIGTTRDRLHQFEHVPGIAASVGVPLEIVSPERALELFPLMNPAGVIAAAHYLPTDGHVGQAASRTRSPRAPPRWGRASTAVRP